MRIVRTIALSAWILAVPGWASANVIEDVRSTTDDKDVIITLQSQDDAQVPIVRTAGGMVRLWLEDAPKQTSLRRRVDSPELSYIEVRPGSNDTAAVRIRLASRKRLDESDVRVSNEGKLVSVRIARSLLASQAASATAVEKTADKVAPSAVTAPVPVPSAAQPAVQKAAAPSAVKAPVFQKKSKPLSEASLAPDTHASMGALLAISVILGLLYLTMRLLQKRRPNGANSPIEIIASKRLGPRHQLLIVRAFGRDHLLSVQGGNTTRIAGAKAGQLMGMDGSIRSGVFELDADSKPAREEPAFGADFLRLAIGQRLKEEMDVARTLSQASESQASDSVSGLLRLRREAGL